MNATRYFFAVLMIVAFPAGMSMWLVIHPFARFWRKRGPVVTYSVVLMVALLIGTVVFRFRHDLLAVEFGFSWPQTVLALACIACGIALEHNYRRQISVGTLLGLPEVSEARPDVLLDQGIYARIRHPRYVGLLFEITGFALFANYLAMYLLVLAAIPFLYLTVLLEERELLQRFGESYGEYMRRVPRFIPKWGARPKS